MDTQNTQIRGRGRPSKYTTEQLNTVLEMLRSGSTIAAAAAATGMSAQNVSYHKRKAGITGAAVPGVLPTVVSDPLTSQETSLIAKYDGEIARLESTIERATARLKETVTKRRRVAKVLGLITETEAGAGEET